MPAKILVASWPGFPEHIDDYSDLRHCGEDVTYPQLIVLDVVGGYDVLSTKVH
jgi:hypothetical protein